jgi:L-methionine (R)-S-oxide reductase
MSNPSELERWLRAWLEQNGAVAGTVHLRDGDALTLGASVNIPAKVVDLVRSVPKGKGMAGLAFERDAPVSTCNLQTDASGDVRPGAKAVAANAAVAIPIHDAHGQVRGVVGIAYLGERPMDGAELARLCAQAEASPCKL